MTIPEARLGLLADRRHFPIIALRCTCGFMVSAMTRQEVDVAMLDHFSAIHLPNVEYVAHTRQH